MSVPVDRPASYLAEYIYGWMGGDRDPYHYVIEVLYDHIAWIVFNPPPHKCDVLCLRLSQAQVYTESCARNTLSRLLYEYPDWQCRAVRFTDHYRTFHALSEARSVGLLN
jgi:hypothetical protein